MNPAPSPVAFSVLPLLGIVLYLVATMAVFGARCLTLGRPRTPYIEARAAPALWKWWMEWWIWLWGPVERTCIALGISPNTITLASTALTGGAAVLLATGHVASGGWLYLLASSLDLVDGRVARAQGLSTRAGAFLDSTLDRVSELFAFAALAVLFRDTPALYAALAAAAASVVVSYARARGESLGVTEEARVGGMQRAERVVLTGLPCAVSPLLDAGFGAGAGAVTIGTCLAVLAVVTTLTAFHRTASIFRALRGPAAAARPLANVRWLDAARRRERLGR